jgi:hypothetical protein
MVKRWFWLAFTAAVIAMPSVLAASDATEFFQIDDLRPGMKGTGKTCYQGTKPEEFQAEILGVLHGVSPGTSVVLARFSGNLIDRVGIFEGMSGSPVYIDGKLLGAIAYSFTFAKEPIGGITPITQMVEAFSEAADPSTQGKVLFKKSRLWNYSLPLPAVPNGSAQLPVIPNQTKQQPLPETFGGHSLVPIATPLNMGGFHSEVIKAFAPQFRAMGMSILQGVGGPDSAAADEGKENLAKPLLEPGSNIVVSLVQGDLDVSAGGTVTHVDGNRLYAFGHSMYSLGFTELPVHTARAIIVFPSLESSFKILEMGELAGTIRQDRGTGIYGIVGEKPQMVPLRIHLTTSRGDKKEFKYELAKDSLLTPLLVNLTVYQTIVSSERAQGMITLKIKGTINIKNQKSVEINNRFSSDSEAPSEASLSIAVPVNYLMAPGYRNLDLQDIDLEIEAQENDQAAILDSIRFDRTEVKAGELLDVEISYKRIDGEVIRETYPVRIPKNASPGELTMLVADGATLMSMDEREEGENLIPRDLTQLIKLINSIRKNDHLYVRFYRQEPGAVVKGEGLPGLPPSILSILRSDRKVGDMNTIRTSTIMEYEMPATDYLVVGSRALELTIEP